MKENKYDQSSFFEAYSQFPRSAQGLQAAGEWHALRQMLPNFAGKRVLDIGCGFGWHCLYAAAQGASYVLGIDISERMLAVAKEKTAYSQVEYRRMAMEDMDFAPSSFDVAISSLAFHYTPDFADICARVARSLAAGGQFIFSVEHPVFTAHGPQEWVCDAEGKRLHWPVDNYFREGKRSASFLGEDVVKYHKTLATYLQTLLQEGFAITGVVEPEPAPHLLETEPGMQDELRRPMMLLVSARKL